MVLRFLGESVTDSNGLAVLPDGYTGTGAGLVDIIAQTTIDESTVVSTPYPVTDCTFYDKATDGTGEKNTNCYNNSSSSFRVTPSNDGTLLECLSATVWGQYYLNQQNNSSKPNPIGTAIEFDIVDVNNMSIQITGNSAYTYTFTQTGHYKITVDNTNIKTFKETDGSYTELNSKTTSTYITDYFNVKFAYRGTDKYIKYANFEIYPI